MRRELPRTHLQPDANATASTSRKMVEHRDARARALCSRTSNVHGTLHATARASFSRTRGSRPASLRTMNLSKQPPSEHAMLLTALARAQRPHETAYDCATRLVRDAVSIAERLEQLDRNRSRERAWRSVMLVIVAAQFTLNLGMALRWWW